MSSRKLESLRAGKIPHLTKEEEGKILALCYEGEVTPYDRENWSLSSHFPFGGLPYVEFTGAPRVGKTTSTEFIARQAKRVGLQTRIIKEPRIRADKSDDYVLAQLAILMGSTSSLALFREEFLSVTRGGSVVLIDRGPHNVIPFLETNRDLGYDYASKAQIAEKYFMEYFSPLVDAVVIFHADPELSLSRDRKRIRENPVMTAEYLTPLAAHFRELPNRIARLRSSETLSLTRPLIVANIDCNNLSLTQTENLAWRAVGSICRLTLGPGK